MLQCVAVCCSVSQCVALSRNERLEMIEDVHLLVNRHSAVCCSVLQSVAVCCSVLQCVAVCYSVLQCVEDVHLLVSTQVDILPYVAVCCSVL